MASLLVVNNIAGRHRGADTIAEIKTAFGSQLPEIALTTHPGHAADLAREAAQSGDFDTVIAAGGDGTINEVVSGLFAARSDQPLPTLGVIPIGTCNVLATELGIPWPGIDASVRIIRDGHKKQIDVGKAGNRYFLLMVSLGVDALAVRDVARPLKQLVGSGAYVMSGLAALARFSPFHVALLIDGAERIETDAFVVNVANVSTYAVSSVSIAPFAMCDDGWLDICIFEKPPNHKIGFLAQVMLALARRHIGDPRVRYYRARTIEIETRPKLAMQIDGDMGGETPLKIKVLAKALTVLTPA
jgi:YegS/Rv2252/BmrU family lipid kinase